MSKAVPRATGQPVGAKGGKRPPQKIDFDYLSGLSGRVEKEIRETEHALVEFIRQERERNSLYETDQTVQDLEAKYPALKGEVRLA